MIERNIANLPATTVAGLSAKLLAVTNYGEFDLAEEWLLPILTDADRLAGIFPPAPLLGWRETLENFTVNRL
ncbi:hypothetical protein [Mesorhizobium huakuii]|uniref:hypothetical protein n=1 Tax=Mesorhizobium huakuii TaxID=28104 RepID=UPI0024E0F8DE|nr:hypothetical protein [Mesorhizobium huakuii]